MLLEILVGTEFEFVNDVKTGRCIPYLSLKRFGRVVNAWRGTPVDSDDAAYAIARDMFAKHFPDTNNQL